MARSIERRIEELEKKSGVKHREIKICIVSGRGLGELLGYGVHGVGYVKRKPGESEKAAYERAMKAALAAHQGTPKVGMMLEDRTDEPRATQGDD